MIMILVVILLVIIIVIIIYTLRDCRRPIAELKSLRGRCLGALRLGFVILGVSTLRELWELWESSGRGVESCGSLGVVFYVCAKLREAQTVVFYVSGRIWEAQSVVFYTLRAGPPTQLGLVRPSF